jgi:hypothetical protein
VTLGVGGCWLSIIDYRLRWCSHQLLVPSDRLPPHPSCSPLSSIPFFLLHLPSEHEDDIGSTVWNHALSGTNGLLRGKVEARWECSLNREVGRPSLWVQNQRAPSSTPERIDLYVADHSLYARCGVLTTLCSGRSNSIRHNPGTRTGSWSTGFGCLLHVLECDVYASTPSPRPR